MNLSLSTSPHFLIKPPTAITASNSSPRQLTLAASSPTIGPSRSLRRRRAGSRVGPSSFEAEPVLTSRPARKRQPPPNQDWSASYQSQGVASRDDQQKLARRGR